MMSGKALLIIRTEKIAQVSKGAYIRIFMVYRMTSETQLWWQQWTKAISMLLRF